MGAARGWASGARAGRQPGRALCKATNQRCEWVHWRGRSCDPKQKQAHTLTRSILLRMEKLMKLVSMRTW